MPHFRRSRCGDRTARLPSSTARAREEPGLERAAPVFLCAASVADRIARVGATNIRIPAGKAFQQNTRQSVLSPNGRMKTVAARYVVVVKPPAPRSIAEDDFDARRFRRSA